MLQPFTGHDISLAVMSKLCFVNSNSLSFVSGGGVSWLVQFSCWLECEWNASFPLHICCSDTSPFVRKQCSLKGIQYQGDPSAEVGKKRCISTGLSRACASLGFCPASCCYSSDRRLCGVIKTQIYCA